MPRLQGAAEAALADVALRGEHMSRSSQGGAQGVAGVMAAVGHEIADEMRCAYPFQAALCCGPPTAATHPTAQRAM